MRKPAALVMALAFAAVLAGCSHGAEPQKLTLADVEALAEKGEALSWSDFEQYDYADDIGSGLYIRGYDIDENYYLLIGGGSTQAPPMYIRMFAKEDDSVWGDVPTGSIEDFITSQNG